MAQIHFHFYLNSIGRAGGAELIIPQRIYETPEERKNVPVLYLLHGAGGDETTAMRYSVVESYADEYGLAVVMPGGELSDFSNMAHGFGYYSYVAEELPSIMYSVFGFAPERQNCFIAGCSMGANASVKIALANPDRYGACGCISGAITFRLPPLETENLDPVKDRYAYMRYDRRKIEGSEEDIMGNARRVAQSGGSAPRIFHAVGTEDTLMLPYARESKKFFESFEGDPFGYTYWESEGEHDWTFGDKALKKFLEFAFGR